MFLSPKFMEFCPAKPIFDFYFKSIDLNNVIKRIYFRWIQLLFIWLLISYIENAAKVKKKLNLL